MKNLVLRFFLSCLIIIITASSYAGNYLPILTWPGTGTYKSDGLDPEVGVEGTTFTFRVKYIDYDDEAPQGNIRVQLTGPLELDMKPENPNDKNYRKGVIYYATSTLPFDSYSYYFKITNSTLPDTEGEYSLTINTAELSSPNGATINLQETGNLSPKAAKQGPIVAPNQILGWLGNGNYENDGVNTENGGTNTVFTYKVKCFGTLSSGYPILSIMGSTGETTHTMKFEGGTTLNGKVYSATHTFSSWRENRRMQNIQRYQ
ncbi:hypothetical protein HY792_00340 [Candidatus Desantisbacteria bacterium]|nr:hypothetical protein [Candidatus Desantisbacteria bacterium]